MRRSAKRRANSALAGEPDLNNVFRMPGALGAMTPVDGNFEASVLAALEQAIQKLNTMREQEGRGMEAELRRRLDSLEKATGEVDKLAGSGLKGLHGKSAVAHAGAD